MNQICIAKKVSHGGVEFLDFALDDSDNLIIFGTFKEASEFLKSEVGTGEELLNYIITTTEAQASNPVMQELLNKAKSHQDATPLPTQHVENFENEMDLQVDTPEEVQFMFVMDCTQFELLNNDSILDKINNRQLAPVIAFVDVANPVAPVPMPNFKLKEVFVDKSSNA